MENNANIGFVTFRDEEARNTFLSLGVDELQILELKIGELSNKLQALMLANDCDTTQHYVNLILSERMYRLEFLQSLINKDVFTIVIQLFREVSTDVYLDNMLKDKKDRPENAIQLQSE